MTEQQKKELENLRRQYRIIKWINSILIILTAIYILVIGLLFLFNVLERSDVPFFLLPGRIRAGHPPMIAGIPIFLFERRLKKIEQLIEEKDSACYDKGMGR